MLRSYETAGVLAIVVVCILCVSFLSQRDLNAHYIAYRIPSAFPELKPYATYVHQLVKATSLMLTKETAKGHYRPNFNNLQKL